MAISFKTYNNSNFEEPEKFPETISDEQAVQIAYHKELEEISNMLSNGLSVLVECDKILIDYIYKYACAQSNRKPVMFHSSGGGLLGDGLGAKIQKQLEELQDKQIFIIKSLEQYNEKEKIDLIFRTNETNVHPQFLAFLDPRLDVHDVLKNRFDVPFSLKGLPEKLNFSNDKTGETIEYLITTNEYLRFKEFITKDVYKQVADLNAIRFRKAMQYISVKVPQKTDEIDIYKEIRKFKSFSNKLQAQLPINALGFWDNNTDKHTVKEFPEELSDVDAIAIAYYRELADIANYLKRNLSVLVVCDKPMTEYIYAFVCYKAGKYIVLDELYDYKELKKAIINLNDEEVMILRSLDALGSGVWSATLYHLTHTGKHPQFLAFRDPSQDVKGVVTSRFDIQITLSGIPRYLGEENENKQDALRFLLTKEEKKCFKDFSTENLYKNVAGFNVLQFRKAMQYVASNVSDTEDANIIYDLIKRFKISTSSEEIEIPKTSFEDIGGYEDIKKQLRNTIELFNSENNGNGEKREQLVGKGFILHGKPGTGKTLFAKAIANELNATIQMISGPELIEKWIGQSEENMRNIFSTARKNAPSVILFDEFDSLAHKRTAHTDGGARASNSLMAQLLTELDGFRSVSNVLVIGTTNRIDLIDRALLRPSRLRAIEIKMPDINARKSIADLYAKKYGLDTMLIKLFELIKKHFDTWYKSADIEKSKEIPVDFFQELLTEYNYYEKSYTKNISVFKDDLKELFSVINEFNSTNKNENNEIVKKLSEQLIEIGKRYDIEFKKNDEQKTDDSGNEESNSFKKDLISLFQQFELESSNLDNISGSSYYNMVISVIAEYTEGFNNDEIRMVFQDAYIDYLQEGKLISPKYFGIKVGEIRKSKEENETMHI